MKQLFDRLPLAFPLRFTERELGEILTDKEIELLLQSGILSQDQPNSSASCRTCGEFHETHVKDEKIFYVCPEAGKELVHPKDLKVLVFNYSQLFKSLSHDLGFDLQLNEIQKDQFWNLGTVFAGVDNVPVYFYLGEVDSQFVSDYPGIIVVASNAQTGRSLTGGNAPVVSLTDILEDKPTKKSFWGKKKWENLIEKRLRRVVFEENGDLMIDGKRIVHVDPSTPQFFFLQVLYNHFNQPVSWNDIFSSCSAQVAKIHGVGRWNIGYTESEFCYQMKSLIKKAAEDKGMVDKVIRPTKTTTGSGACRLTYIN